MSASYLGLVRSMQAQNAVNHGVKHWLASSGSAGAAAARSGFSTSAMCQSSTLDLSPSARLVLGFKFERAPASRSALDFDEN